MNRCRAGKYIRPTIYCYIGDEDTLDGVTSPTSLQHTYQVISNSLPDVDGTSISQTSTLTAASKASFLAADVEQGIDCSCQSKNSVSFF